jgi:cation transport ATPase
MRRRSRRRCRYRRLGADVTQNAADVVFQGARLGPVRGCSASRAADRLVRQNLVLAIAYNIAAVPLAVPASEPLVAAAAICHRRDRHRQRPPVGGEAQ